MAKNRPNVPGSTTPTAPGTGAGGPGAGGSGGPGAAGGGTAGGATAGCPQCTITSETEATIPANRARTRIGVGERVTLTVSPAPATWSASGGGQVSPTSGASVTFTAGDVGGSATITAQTAACSCTIEFEVVAPNGVHMERIDSRGLHHIHGTPSVGFVGKPFILPADVSFENIEYREEEVQAVGTGFLSGMTGQGHHPNPSPLTVGAVVEGTGSEADGIDEITVTISSVTPPMAAGTVTWSIPWVYQVGSGGEHPLATVDQVATIDAQGSMTISKGGASATRALNDPTSHLDTSLP